jgi:hypothetical protein
MRKTIVLPVRLTERWVRGLLLCALLPAGGCIEDKGSYDYHDVNSITISGINHLTEDPPYLVSVGDNLRITPTLEFSLGEARDTYRYEWHQMGNSVPYQSVRLLSTERNLNLKIEGSMRYSRIYYLMYCVTNLTTGVRYDCVFRVEVQDRVGKGYIVLHEQGGDSFDIDLIASYGDSLTHYRNLLDMFESSLPRTGRKPLDILCYYDRTAPSPYDTNEKRSYSVWVLTDKSSDRIKAEDYSYISPDYNISKLSLIPPTLLDGKELVAQKMVSSIVGTNPNSARSYIYFNGNWFFFNLATMTYFFNQPLNVWDGTDTTYAVAPYIIPVTYYGAIMFDEDNRRFMLHQTNGGDMYSSSKIYCSLKLDGGETYFPWENPAYRLVYMGNKTWQIGFAVVQDAEANAYHLLQMTVVYNMGAYQLAKSTFPEGFDASAIKYFAFHPSLPYLYCATEDRVYKILITTMALTDVTEQVLPAGHTISVMEFLFVRAPRTGLLAVATCDPSGEQGQNATLAFYDVNNGTGALTLANHPAEPTPSGYQIPMRWTGLGKIVALDYKEQ